MLDDILAALRVRVDLQAWTVRHVTSRGAQVFAVPTTVEARRATHGERYVVDVLRQTPDPDGAITCGSGNTTLLPGDDIGKALDTAALIAGLVHNPPHTIPGPAPMPEVELADAALQDNAAATLDDVLARLRASVAAQPGVRLTAAECFGEEQTTHLVNSRGLDAMQVSTHVDVEWVLLGKKTDQEVESFEEISRRRVADLDLEAEVARQTQYVADRLAATPPPDYDGPVILRSATLATFLNGGVLQTLAAASSKFSQITSFEIGKSVFQREVAGDPLTVWANRRLPYGMNACRFDEEGLPAQRVELIRDNRLVTFIASQRYADYLSIPPTGAFGDIELPAGKTPAAALLAEPHVEVTSFSWFNPDPVTGAFASEIRLGYVVNNGRRTPFKGGMLVGNVLDALADAHWSAETGFYGNYQGPMAARFSQLKVAGDAQA
jgi:PmbA protein